MIRIHITCRSTKYAKKIFRSCACIRGICLLSSIKDEEWNIEYFHFCKLNDHVRVFRTLNLFKKISNERSRPIFPRFHLPLLSEKTLYEVTQRELARILSWKQSSRDIF